MLCAVSGVDPEEFGTGESSASAIVMADDTSGGAISDSVDLEDTTKLLEINSAIAVEKEIACDTMGTLFVATRSLFMDYVELCVLELLENLTHYYEGIRKTAMTSLLEIVQTFYELSEPQDWVPGRAMVSLFCQEMARKGPDFELADCSAPQECQRFD